MFSNSSPQPEGLRMSFSRRLKETFTSSSPRPHSRLRSELNSQITALSQTLAESIFDRPLPYITPNLDLDGAGYEFISRGNSRDDLSGLSVWPPAAKGSERITTPGPEVHRRLPSRPHSPALFLNCLPTGPPPDTDSAHLSVPSSEVHVTRNVAPSISEALELVPALLLSPPIQTSITENSTSTVSCEPQGQPALLPAPTTPQASVRAIIDVVSAVSETEPLQRPVHVMQEYAVRGPTTTLEPQPRRLAPPPLPTIQALLQAANGVAGVVPEVQPRSTPSPLFDGQPPASLIVNVDSPTSPTSYSFPPATSHEDTDPCLLAPNARLSRCSSKSSLCGSLYPRSSSPQCSITASSGTEDLENDTSFNTMHAQTASRTTLESVPSRLYEKLTFLDPSGGIISGSEISRPPSASSVSRISVKSFKETGWAVLEAGLRTLEKCSGTTPLGLVAAGLVGCVDTIQESERHRKDYSELAKNLSGLVGRLTNHIQQSKSTKPSDCALSIATALQKHIDDISAKQRRNKASRYAEAKDDQEDLVERYRQIEMLFGRLECDAMLSVWSVANEQTANTRLDGLSPAKQAWYDSNISDIRRRACTPNTRKQILAELHEWANNPNGSKIYWLNGMAGTGKTTIAYSFCSELEQSHQLGASFFCCRTLPECRDVARIVPTIAYQLARASYPFQSALCDVLSTSPDLGARSVSLQFEKLVRGPLLQVKHTLPLVLVVVVDALDECAGHDGAQPFLDALLHHAGELPIKFFVTGRPERSVHNKLGSLDNYMRSVLHLHDIEESLVQTDIETYLDEELKFIPKSSGKVKILASRAKNLFIYAATAVRYIKPDGLAVDPYKRLDAMLEMHSDPASRKNEEIDVLYTAILVAALGPRLETKEIETIRTVLNTVICLREPMDAGTLARFLGLPGGETVELSLEHLRSVLHIPDSPGPISTLHVSFPDYMLNTERSGGFGCDRKIHCKLMAQRCFETMARSLRFNICDLESSSVFDKDVPNLQERVNSAISPQLFYACKYWGDHLRHVPPSLDMLALLETFLSEQLLFWMEVLNLKGCIGAGGKLLLQAHMWLESFQTSDEIRNLILDARKFVVTFSANPVSHSTPHIYISVLPFWSTTGPVWETYEKRMKGLVKPEGTAMERRDRSNVAVWTVASRVMSIAVSSDGTRTVSGSEDFLLRLWDSRSGKLAMNPLEGHSGGVVSVAFSPSDTMIASGSNDHTVRIWDAWTGHTLAGPLVCGNSCVTSVAFSPRDDLVVSGTLDNQVRVWDARRGSLIAGPFKVHTDSVKSVAFSPRGIYVASGSDDSTICVWDLSSGSVVAGPFRAHDKPVNSVAFSPDGELIASGSDDCSISIWDAWHNGAGPKIVFNGHTDLVSSVAFSPDGAYVASGSYDRTVRVWSLKTKDIAFGPFKGHTDTVTSVVFTPDGTYVLSGSRDKSIRIWDLKSKSTTAAPFEGHTDHVCSVAFSADATQIVSSSHDCTVRIWDAWRGSAVSRPFLKTNDAIASFVTFSPEGSRVALGLNDGTVCIWDSKTGKDVVEPFRRHRGWITSLAFSPDGHYVVSGSATGDAFVWSTRSGRVLAGPLRHPSSSPIRSVMFSPDGKWVISSADNGTICVRDTRKGAVSLQMMHELNVPVRSVAFSPSSNFIVSGSDDCTVRIWDAKTGRTAIGPLKGHIGPVSTVAYSSDGVLVASGSYDRTIRVWNAKTGTLVVELKGHMDIVSSIAFSPNEARIVSGSFDRVIRIWDVSRNASSASNASKSWNMSDDGWVASQDNRLLLWVPNDLRTGLIRPYNPIAIYRRGSLQLNFNDTVTGKRWAECFAR